MNKPEITRNWLYLQNFINISISGGNDRKDFSLNTFILEMRKLDPAKCSEWLRVT